MGTSTTEKFASQIGAFGIKPSKVHRNLGVDGMVAIAVARKEGVVNSTGSLSVNTGKYTGRSPDDRFIVYDDKTRDTIDWGQINHQFPSDKFEKLLEKMKNFVENKELFVFDGFVGADPETCLPVRVINDHVWQSMFSSNLFIRPTNDELEKHEPEFTILCINDFVADPKIDGTRTDVFILIDLTRKIVLIGGTEYAGEMKKSMFGVMNFLLPERGIFPMHCSANIGEKGDTVLFFGLSGTGKTTLSADPNRKLIGDDEHGWSDNGTFNFEGGCYAKCINLSKEAEPEIWNAIRPGALLENVVLNNNVPDYNDNTLTENTRVGYPLDYIPGAVIPSIGGNPKVIVFLTADALGVLPPVSRLTTDGAMYHFMSGYTSKLAGTERGIKEPKSVFSQCFGAPFMPRPASVYAKLLGEKISQHDTVVYLVNTGWSGGPYGVGKRIKIKYSRAMITSALSGALDTVKYRHDDLFNLDIPTEVDDVPSEILDPRNTWADGDSYESSAKKLAQMFVDNFKKFDNVSPEIINAGPKSTV
ncbi:MAG: phosphoenolpyruvate carboxykinase (ATP) [Nitrosopumilus sp.]|nr:phosphoenolpyruvate carboxykinase (ATP) [Nitrosopumilus sp.]MDF2426242.1 phosphoenolpyruvate carboxykinase (ATP) [Nitrosopumilus sp.]MDF2426705.1 phosphoenolpyruvate carboxykinase (ATP) [Nitrosopumilus sp.]MDF2430361.1 phosphoenolpyruvate carboxykinase (ATP) [Nitrosopumilus sp.]